MRFLILTAVYPPDPASVGQHLADVANALAKRGHIVRVLTPDRGYDNPSVRFSRYEISSGIEISRLRWSSFGKSSIIIRLMGQFFFALQTIVKTLFSFRPDVILITTSPPLGVIPGYILSKLKKSNLVYWVMDINPDEAIALGAVKESSILAILLDFMNKIVLSHSDRVIVLDSYMAKRIKNKAILTKEPIIIPPWPHEDAIKKSNANGNKFRTEHGLQNKFIVMYSGNHSWVHPLDTIIEAAKQLVYRKDIVFVFVGGGVEKKKVEIAIKNGAKNILSLPYQPLCQLGESLAAADVHLVVMGGSMVGIVHPCKVYGAMAVGRPILAIAPDNSHISDIINKYKIGLRFNHGDIDGVVRGILTFADMDKKEREVIGENAARAVREEFSQEKLRNKFIKILEEIYN
jgi:glycosyltransferase involved in cell wall biosynthesis